MKEKKTSDRIKEIMAEKGLRQIDILNKAKPFCKKYNVKLGRNDLSQYISGKVEPSQKKLTVLAETLEVNEAWLMGYDIPKNAIILTPDDYITIDRNVDIFKKGDEIKIKQIFERIEILYEKTLLLKKGNKVLEMLKETEQKKNFDNMLKTNKITLEQYEQQKQQFLKDALKENEMTFEEFKKYINDYFF